jgi:hypothetical protein
MSDLSAQKLSETRESLISRELLSSHAYVHVHITCLHAYMYMHTYVVAFHTCIYTFANVIVVKVPSTPV